MHPSESMSASAWVQRAVVTDCDKMITSCVKKRRVASSPAYRSVNPRARKPCPACVSARPRARKPCPACVSARPRARKPCPACVFVRPRARKARPAYVSARPRAKICPLCRSFLKNFHSSWASFKTVLIFLSNIVFFLHFFRTFVSRNGKTEELCHIYLP